jgi:hypothetical protein
MQIDPDAPYEISRPAHDEAFVAREKIVQQLLEDVETPNRRTVVLFGGRRVGKSSVANEVLKRLRKSTGCFPVLFDLSLIASISPERIQDSLADAIYREARRRGFIKQDASQNSAPSIPLLLNEFRDLFDAGNLSRIVLILDEFDVPAQHNRDHDKFYSSIRSMSQNLDFPFLKFLWVVAEDPQEEKLPVSLAALLKSADATRHLGLFDMDECAQLVTKNGELSEYWSAEIVETIWKVTGGLPGLIQAVCRQLWLEQMPHENNRKIVLTKSLSELGGSVEAICDWIWNGFEPEQKLILRLLTQTEVIGDSLLEHFQELGYDLTLGQGDVSNAPESLIRKGILRKIAVDQNAETFEFTMPILRDYVKRQPRNRIDYETFADKQCTIARDLYRRGDFELAQMQLNVILKQRSKHRGARILQMQLLLAQAELLNEQENMQDAHRLYAEAQEIFQEFNPEFKPFDGRQDFKTRIWSGLAKFTSDMEERIKLLREVYGEYPHIETYLRLKEACIAYCHALTQKNHWDHFLRFASLLEPEDERDLIVDVLQSFPGMGQKSRLLLLVRLDSVAALIEEISS